MSLEDIIFEKLTKQPDPIELEGEAKTEVNYSEHFKRVDNQIAAMQATEDNFAYRTVYSHRKLIGGLIVFVKRVIRKLVKWYIEPICYQQTEFNRAAAQAVVALKEASLSCVTSTEEQLHSIEAHRTAESFGFQTAVNEKLLSLEEQLTCAAEAVSTLQEQMAKLHNPGDFEPGDIDDRTVRFTTAQSGEDAILEYIMFMMGVPEKERTYLDLGANHAKLFSNTYIFYKHGARGVLVEANPDLIKELKFYRSGDVILNRCISDKSCELVDFYILNGDGLSAPDKERVDEVLDENASLRVEKVIPIETITVNEIMDTYFDGAPAFLNIDIEGKEQEILDSIDFERHRPLLISIETIPYRTHLVVGEKNEEVVRFMASKDYVEYAFTGINSIFIDKRKAKFN